MKEIFEIATRVSTPLALAGLIAAIVFFVFRQILSRPGLIPQLGQDAGAVVVKRIITVLFILGLVAMVLGVIGYIVPPILAARYPSLSPDYVDMGTDRDLPLKAIASAVAEARNVTIIFNPNCGESVPNAVIEKGDHDGSNLKDFLENLKQRVKGSGISYSVKSEGPRRYEITCP